MVLAEGFSLQLKMLKDAPSPTNSLRMFKMCRRTSFSKGSKHDVKMEGKPEKFVGIANIVNISFNFSFEIILDSL